MEQKSKDWPPLPTGQYVLPLPVKYESVTLTESKDQLNIHDRTPMRICCQQVAIVFICTVFGCVVELPMRKYFNMTLTAYIHYRMGFFLLRTIGTSVLTAGLFYFFFYDRSAHRGQLLFDRRQRLIKAGGRQPDSLDKMSDIYLDSYRFSKSYAVQINILPNIDQPAKGRRLHLNHTTRRTYSLGHFRKKENALAVAERVAAFCGKTVMMRSK